MEIDFNKLANYESLAYGSSNIAQLGKVKEEYKELLAEVRETSTFSYVKDRDKFIAEGLDLITATVNLLLISGLTEQDFKKHIAKLESYKVGKYKRKGRSGISMGHKVLIKKIIKPESCVFIGGTAFPAGDEVSEMIYI